MNTTAALSFRAANNPYAYAPDKAYSATAASHVAAPSNAATDVASYTACQVMATLSMRTSSDAAEPAWNRLR